MFLLGTSSHHQSQVSKGMALHPWKKRADPGSVYLLMRLGVFFRLLLCMISPALSNSEGNMPHHKHVHHQGDPQHRHNHLLHAEVIPSVRLDRLPVRVGGGKGERRLAGETLHEEGNEEQNVPELDAPFGRHLALSFNAFGKSYQVDLSLHDSLFDEGAMTHGYDENGQEILRRPRAVAYQGSFPGGRWIRATVHQEDVIHAIWYENGQINMIVPASTYAYKAPHIFEHAKQLGGRMFAFHLHDMPHDEHDRKLLDTWLASRGGWDAQRRRDAAEEIHPTEKKEEAEVPVDPSVHTAEGGGGDRGDQPLRGRELLMTSILENAAVKSLNPYGLMSGCPSTIYKVAIGVAVDAGYTRALTGFASLKTLTAAAAITQVEVDVQTQLNIVNLLYTDMINVFVSLGNTDIRTVSGTVAWNQQPANAVTLSGGNRHTYGCPTSKAVTDDSDYLTTLTNFGTWRNTLASTSKYAIWHLMTDCYPPAGTVGLAYIGVTCNSGANGVSWASFQSEGTWLTVAHEIGHNFGAYHTMATGGIMSYDAITIKEYKFTGTNPSEICNHVNAVKGVCYSVMKSTCGNRILEPGEDCDDASACCDQTTCKLVGNAQCSPGLDPDCCTALCKFLPTTTSCNLPGADENGYCYNGMCHLNRLAAAYSNLAGCSPPTTSPCIENVIYNGACGYTQTSFGLTGYNMPDGAYCDAALSKVCLLGTCVSAINLSTPTKSPTKPPPTKGPTSKPTPQPTTSPTKTPTEVATKAPTSLPTKIPSKAPTSIPSKAPSKLPSLSPTRAPSKLPTSLPTKIPSKSPTSSPTKAPTKPATFPPTKIPTKGPTFSPTKLPTKATLSPTKIPTKGPTSSPTKLPTQRPTLLPTKLPTQAATILPTTGPTSSPTKVPTRGPTLLPTKLPTQAATFSPTKWPTSSPTKAPSKVPTSLPTKLPTQLATSSPTKLPTQGPTLLPTKLPTQAATGLPTKIPTSSPTKLPTNVPTSSPSKAPITPTTPPSKGPSKSPTRLPTTPTKSPTRKPTNTPSNAPVVARRELQFMDEQPHLVDEDEGEEGTGAEGKDEEREERMAGEGGDEEEEEEEEEREFFNNDVEDGAEAAFPFKDDTTTNSADGLVIDPTPAPTSASPTLIVTNPAVGEGLYVGSTVLISWTASITLATAHIELSDGTIIANRLSVGDTSGTYYWSIMASPGTYSILVRGYQAGNSVPLDGYSGVFTIEQQYTLQVTSPILNQVIAQGEGTTITWTSTGTITDVTITVKSISIFGSTGVVSIGSQPNTGSYTWVPSGNLAQGKYQVIITFSPPSQTLVTAKSGIFRLRQPTEPGIVTFLNPQPGESLTIWKNYTIMWTSPVTVDTANLYLTQPGTSLNVLLYSGGDDNSYTWTVGATTDNTTLTAGSGYRLVLIDSDSKGVASTLNATSGDFSIFNLQPQVTITSIFTDQLGSVWTRGKTATIFFNSFDPADTITFQIQDQNGALVYAVATDVAATAKNFTMFIPYQAPPSDCFSCFLVAISNTYSGIYHTYPVPFSIGSNEFSDLLADHVEPSLVLSYPLDGSVLERGKQYNITWTGILVPTVIIVLTNVTGESTTILDTVENTGLYNWNLPFDNAIVGDYELSLWSQDTSLSTPPISLSIKDPSSSDEEEEGSISFTQSIGLSTIVEGDSVTIYYTSQDVFQPVTVEIISPSLGVISTLTTSAPASGSYTLIVPHPSSEPNLNAYIRISAAGVSAQSSKFTLYKLPSLTNVAVPVSTLYKGEVYRVTWETTGIPFPISVLLYEGTINRQTVTGDLCVPWKDNTGRNFTGCTLSYDLVHEVCATAVDTNGVWAAGGTCVPITDTFKLVLSLTSTAISRDGQAFLKLPASSNDLPAPGTDYSIVVSAASPGVQQSAQSPTFAIASPTVTLIFRVIQTDPGLDATLIRQQVLTFLSDSTGIASYRIGLNMTTLMATGDATVIQASALLDFSSSPADVSAYDAAWAFVDGWEDPGSILYASEDLGFQVDPTSLPIVLPREDVGAEPVTQAPTPVATLPGEIPDSSPPFFPPRPPAAGSGDDGNTFPNPEDEVTNAVPGGGDSGSGDEPSSTSTSSANGKSKGLLGGDTLTSSIGLAAACVGVAALVFLGVYVLRRRQVFNSRGRSRSTLRVQQQSNE